MVHRAPGSRSLHSCKRICFRLVQLFRIAHQQPARLVDATTRRFAVTQSVGFIPRTRSKLLPYTTIQDGRMGRAVPLLQTAPFQQSRRPTGQTAPRRAALDHKSAARRVSRHRVPANCHTRGDGHNGRPRKTGPYKVLMNGPAKAASGHRRQQQCLLISCRGSSNHRLSKHANLCQTGFRIS